MIIWNKKTRQQIAKVDGDIIPEVYRNGTYIGTSDNPGRSEMVIKGLRDLDEWEYIKDGKVLNWSRDEMILRGHTELMEDGEKIVDGKVVNIREQLLAEKAEFQAWLSAHDYIGIKIATGRATAADYADVIEEMNQKAARIDEIQSQLYS